MEKDQIFILKDRGIIYISGEDVKEFLQNIITNDINKVSDTSSCFASLLTPQGKYLFDFIIIRHKQGYFVDCEKNQIDQLIDRLNIYKLNSKIEILNLSNEFEVAVIGKEKFLTLENAKDIVGNTVKYNGDPVTLDPRSKMCIRDRINTDKLQDKVFGLECNFEELNGIDFKKGCYVGQENTARMKLKNKLRRKLLPLKSNEKLNVGSNVMFNKVNVGKVLINEPYPFALIKLFDPDFSDFKNKEILADNKKVNIITS